MTTVAFLMNTQTPVIRERSRVTPAGQLISSKPTWIVFVEFGFTQAQRPPWHHFLSGPTSTANSPTVPVVRRLHVERRAATFC